MLTIKLPQTIKTTEEAKQFLTALYNAGMAYHCEDDAREIDFLNVDEDQRPTTEEAERLNSLMDDIYNIPGTFDPCQYLLNLAKGYRIETKPGSHTAIIYKGGKVFKCIAGDILPDGSHNAEAKAQQFIDNIGI